MDLADALRRRNSWWATGTIDNDLLYKRIRSEFSSITRNLSSNTVIYLTGPRRVGKSVMLYQTVDYLLKMGIPSEHILYINGDDFAMSGEKASIREILEIYCIFILHKNIDEPKERIYVLIDDLHLFKDFQTYLYYYSHSGANFKFIASTPSLPEAEWSDTVRSSTLADSFKGVFMEVPVQPFTLLQFIEMYCVYRQIDFDLIKYKSMLPESGLFDRPRDYFLALQSGFSYFSNIRALKLKMIEEYYLAGGYPGYFEAANLSVWHKSLREDILEHSLFRDIVGVNNIKQPNALRRLMYLIPAIEGGELSFTAVGDVLEIDTVTTISYLNQLEESGLIRICENISGETVKIKRKNKKLFLSDNGMRNALLGVSKLSGTPNAPFCQIQCMALAKDYANRVGGQFGFLRSGSASADVAVKKSGMLLTVKTGCVASGTLAPRELKEISAVAGLKTPTECIIITSDLLKQAGNVYYIPYWML